MKNSVPSLPFAATSAGDQTGRASSTATPPVATLFRRPRFAKAALFAAAALAVAGASAGALQAVDINAGTIYETDDLQNYSTGDFNMRGGTLKYTGPGQNVTRNFPVAAAGSKLEVSNADAVLYVMGNGDDNAYMVTKTGPGTLVVVGGHNNTTCIGVNEGLLLFQGAGGAGSSMYPNKTVKDYAVTVSGTGKVFFETTSPSNPLYYESGLMVNDSGEIDFNGRSQSLAYLDGNGGTVKNTSNTVSTLTIGGTFYGGSRAQSQPSEYAGNIVGNISIISGGNGSLTLSGVNEYTGATTISTGPLILKNGGKILNSDISLSNDASVYFSISGINYGTVIVKSLTGGGTVGGYVKLGSNNLQIGKHDDTRANFTFSGTVGEGGDAGSLIKEGNFRLTLASTNYGGETVINQGTLALSGNGANINTAASSGVTLSTDSAALAVLDLSGIFGTSTVKIQHLQGGGEVDLGGKALEVGADNESTTFSGVFTGTGSVVKQGSGTFTLTGDSSFFSASEAGSYAFKIEGGVLEFDHVGEEWGYGALGSNSLRFESLDGGYSPAPDRLTDLIGFSDPDALLRYTATSVATEVLLKGLKAEGSGIINIDIPTWNSALTVVSLEGDVVKTGAGTLIYGDLPGAEPEDNTNTGNLTVRDGKVVLGKTTGISVTGDVQLVSPAGGDSVLQLGPTSGTGSGNQITGGNITLAASPESITPLLFGTTLNLNGQSETLEDATGEIAGDLTISGTSGVVRIISETGSSGAVAPGSLFVRDFVKSDGTVLRVGAGVTLSAKKFTSGGGLWAFEGTATAPTVLTANSLVGSTFEIAANTTFTGTATLNNLSLIGTGDLTLGIISAQPADITLVGGDGAFPGKFVINTGSTLSFATPYSGEIRYGGGVIGGGSIVQKGADTVILGDGSASQILNVTLSAESGRLLVAGTLSTVATATGTGILGATVGGTIGAANAVNGGTVIAIGTGIITAAATDTAGSSIGVELGGTISQGQVASGSTFLSGLGTVTTLTLGTGGLDSVRVRPSSSGGATGAIVENLTINGNVAVDALGAASGVALAGSGAIPDFPVFSYNLTNTSLTASEVEAWGIYNQDYFRQNITISAVEDALALNYTLVSLKFEQTSSGDILWNGQPGEGNSTWNYYSGNQVWLTNDGSLTPDWFHVGDQVSFTSTAANKDVWLVGDLYPSSVLVQAATGETYRFYNAHNVAGKITGPATLTKEGLGTLVIETPNDNTGAILIHAGTVLVPSIGSIGTGPVTFDGDGITLTVETLRPFTNALSVSGTGNTLTLSGAFSGPTLHIEPTASGDVSTLSLTIPHDSTFGAVLSGEGRITLEGSAGQERKFPVANHGAFEGAIIGVAGDYVFNGGTSGTIANWSKTTFETAASAPVLKFVNGISVYEFASLASGTIQIDNVSASADVLEIATGNIARAADALGEATITGGRITVGATASKTLTIDTNNAALTKFAAVFSAAGAGETFVKTGAGTLQLTGGEVAADTINVNNGKLELVKGASLGTAGARTFTVGNGVAPADDEAPVVLHLNYTGVVATDGDVFGLNGSNIALNHGVFEVSGYSGGDTDASVGRTIDLTGTGTWRVNNNRFGLLAGRIALDSASEIIVEGGNGIWHNTTGAARTYWDGNEAKLTLESGSILDLRGNGVTVGGLQGPGTVLNSTGILPADGANTLTIGLGTVDTDIFLFAGKINAGSQTTTGTVLGSAITGAPNASHAAVNLVKVGNGTQIFTGTVSSNAITVTSGTLQFGTATADATYTPGASATILNNSHLVFDYAAAPAAIPAVSISGSGVLEKRGNGTLSLGGTMSYSGATLVKAGSLVFTNSGHSSGSYIEIEPGATFSVGANTITLIGNTSGNDLSYAGHLRSLANAPTADIIGNLVLNGGHILRVGEDAVTTLGNASFAELKITGSLILADSLPSGITNTLLLDVANPLNHDTITVGGVFDVTSSEAKLTIGTADGILMPGTYTLVTAVGGVGPSLGAWDDATLLTIFTGSSTGDLTTALGLESTPSLENVLKVGNSGTTLDLVVEGTGVTYTWNKTSVSPENWNHESADTIWIKHDPRPGGSTTDSSRYDPYGNVVFVEDSSKGFVTQVDISEIVRPLEITVRDRDDGADLAFTGYTITNSRNDGTDTGGRIEGPGKLIKTSSGTLTLDVTPDATKGHSFTGSVSITGGKLLVTNSANSAIPVIGNIGEASLLGAGLSAQELSLYSTKSAAGLYLANGATLALDSVDAVSTNRSFSVGLGGGAIEILGERVSFLSADAVEFAEPGESALPGERILEINTGASEALFNLKFGSVLIPAELPDDPPSAASLTLKKTGIGTLFLTGTANTSPVTVEEGRLSINNSGSAGDIALNGGTLTNWQSTGIANSFTFPNAVSFADGSKIEVYGSTSALTLSNSLIGAPGATLTTLTKTGDGILALVHDNSSTLGADVQLKVSDGALRLSNRNASGSASIHLESTGNLQTGTDVVVIAGLTGSGFVSNPFSGTTRTLNVNIASGTSVFSGSFQNGSTSGSEPAVLALRKSGAGTLALDGTTSYGTATGTVTVEDGILQLKTSRALAATSEFFITSGVGASGTLDIYRNDISASSAVFSGSGTATVLDSYGNGTFPKLVLNASATVSTAGNSFLSTASSSLAGASRPTLTLAPDIAPTSDVDIARVYSFVLGSSAESFRAIDLSIRSGATLQLDQSGLLAASTALVLQGTGPSVETDSTLSLAAGITQTLASLTGTGTVTGAAGGVLTVSTATGSSSATRTFNGALRGNVGLTVQGAGLVLAPSLGENYTDGTITVDGSVLWLNTPLAISGANDVLGKRDSAAGAGDGSKIFIRDGVLVSDTVTRSSTDRAFTLRGATSTFRSEGPGGLHINGGAAFTVDSASAHTLVLDGSTGTPWDISNFFEAYLEDSAAGGSLALKKTGTGTWFIGQGEQNSLNAYTGGTLIENGTLVLATPNAIGGQLLLGAAGANTSGALKLNGNDLTLSGIAVRGEGASNRIYNGLAGATPTLTLSVAAGAPTTYEGILGKAGDADANNFNFVKTGPGTLILHLDERSSFLPTATYTGDTVVAAGTLAVSGTTHLTSGKISVASGATLDSSGMVGDFGISIDAGQRLTAGGVYDPAHFDVLGNLTLNGGDLYVGSDSPDATARVLNIASPGSTLRVRTESGVVFTLSGSLQGNNSLLHATNLAFDAQTNISVITVDRTLAIGSYKLADYTRIENAANLRLTDSTLTIDGRYDITLSAPGASSSGPSGPGSIFLNVLSVASIENALLWVGDVAVPGPQPHWDGITENFATPTGSRTAYFPGETAIFDDSAISTDITVGVNTSIGYAIFSNNNQDYTISGQPILGEGWIEKRGTGTLTLLSENNYFGIRNADGSNKASTYLTSGTLEVGHDRALGSGLLYITGASTLRAVGGERTLANNIALNTGVTATFDAGIVGLVLTGSLSGDAASRIFKTGDGILQPAPDGSKFHGLISAESGTIRLADAKYSDAAFQLGTEGATLDINGLSEVGELRGEVGSLLTGNGELKTGARNATSNFQGDASGVFSLLKVGTSTLTLTGDLSAHGGSVIVQEGSLRIGDGISGKLGTGGFSVAEGGSLVLNLPVGASVTSDISSVGFIEKQGAAELEISGANADLGGQLRVTGGILRLSGSGTLGTADIEVRAGTLLLARSGDYILPNNISGAGELVKDSDFSGVPGTAIWLGTGDVDAGSTVRGVNIHVQSGAFQIGDGVTALDQVQLQSTRVDADAALILNPAAGGSITLGDVESAVGVGGAADAVVLKTGEGKATLTAYVRANGGIVVEQGTLAIGDGLSTGTITVPGALSVVPDATLEFNRDSVIYVSGKLSGAGAVKFLSGETILQNTNNALSGGFSIASGAVLQVGDAGRASRLGDGPLVATVNDGATLRFVNVAGGEPLSTGSGLALAGQGVVEYSGAGTLRQNSDTAAFHGSFLASEGTFAFDAAALPVSASFDAANNGVLKIESAASEATLNAPKFGTGNGTILLASADPTGPATFTFAGDSAFANGTLAVDSGTTLHLVSANTLGAKEFVVRSGATLDGAGTLQGNLRNDGSFLPGAAVNISGDFINTGLLVVSIGAGSSTSVNFGGAATIAPSSSLELQATSAVYQELLDGKEIRFLHDTVPGAGGKPDLSGAFLPDNISIVVNNVVLPVSALTYSKGDGWLTMIISDNIRDIPDVRNGLHKGLLDFADYLNDTLREDGGALSAAVGAILGAPGGVVNAINAASPVGLASITGMGIGTAHDDAANLHSHLEASRFSRFNLKSPRDTDIYFTGTGNYEQNSGRSGPAYDYNSYGGTVGVDQAFGTQFLAGISAGYHRSRATMDYGAGSVAQDNARLTAYASVQFFESLYADTSIHGGYSYNDIKHSTTGGLAGAEPESYDFGASVSLGGAFGLSKALSITPYGAFEYEAVRVNAFTETGKSGFVNDAALSLDAFKQESLRAKIGTGVNWLVPVQQLRTFRLNLDVAYAYELLDTELDINGRFAADASGRAFKLLVPEQSRHILQLGPSVDIGFNDHVNFQLGYRFESNFEHQLSHHVNATFRVRF